MEKFSVGQLKSISTISGNVSVAWFVSGIISQIFLPIDNLVAFTFQFIVSLILAITFAIISLEFVKDVEL